MKKEYEDIINEVCCTESWHRGSRQDREAAVGVACLLSFIGGTKPSVSTIAKDIDAPPEAVEVPFRRLLINGVFSDRFDAKHDEALLGSAMDRVVGGGLTYSSTEQTRNAWATAAGIASGLTGLRDR